MYERLRVNVKVKPCTTCTFTRDTLYNLYFSYVRKMYVRAHVRIMRQWKSNLKEKVSTSVSRPKRSSD